VIVDREAALHRELEAALATDSVEVVRSATALGALSTCTKLEPLCVVADMSLPDHDGLWLAGALRASAGQVASTPIVLLATGADATVHARAAAAGVDWILAKPIDLVELRAQVRALMAVSARLRGAAERTPSAPTAGVVLGPKREPTPAPMPRPGRLVTPPPLPRPAARQLTPPPIPRADRVPTPPPIPTISEPAAPTPEERASLLGLLESVAVGRRTGELRLYGGGNRGQVVLSFASGALVSGRVGAIALRPLDAMREALHVGGPHRFVVQLDEPPPEGARALREILDEALREESDAATSSRPPRAVTGPRPRVQLPPTRSGLHRRVETPAPRRAIQEEVVPSARPDPRAEPIDGVPTRRHGAQKK
jgi:CheY-like chemotaxis protein